MNQIVIEDNTSARSYNGNLNTISPVLRKYLTWGIVIAYNRGDVLLRCLRNALKQNRPLSEIVVVDASPDWEANRDAVHKLIHDHADNGNIRICYAKAEKLSSTTQRNQGIELATADVLFLIDDDSLMHPECAEEVMRLYEADTARRVTGVMCCPTGAAPDETFQSDAIQHQCTNKENWLRSTIKKFLETDTTYFLPCDGDYPKHDDLSELEGLNFGVIHYMAGYAMTFRREIFEKVRFCELLERYAAGEDQDLSYRASRHGPILLAVNAPIHHLEISTARLPRRVTIAFADLNPAAMHVLYCSDLDRIARSWRRILYKRFLIRILKDIADRDLRFERARGSLISLKRIGIIYRQTPEKLLETYGALQNEIIEKATR